MDQITPATKGVEHATHSQTATDAAIKERSLLDRRQKDVEREKEMQYTAHA